MVYRDRQSWYAVSPDVGTADDATVLREHTDRAFSSTSQGVALPAQP